MAERAEKEPIKSGPYLEFHHAPTSGYVVHVTLDSTPAEEQADEDDEDDTSNLGDDSYE